MGKAVRNITSEQLRERERFLFERVFEWQARWTLGLAVGNGGALAAVTGKLVTDLSASEVALMFPSAWMFAIGLIAAGAAPAVDLMMFHKWRNEVAEHIAFIESAENAEVKETLDKTINWRQWVLEAFSGAAFAAGLLYPLIVLSLRYLRSGGFAVG